MSIIRANRHGFRFTEEMEVISSDSSGRYVYLSHGDAIVSQKEGIL